MNVKKITLLMLSAVMAFSFTGCSKKDTGEEQKKFDEAGIRGSNGTKLSEHAHYSGES